MNTHSLKRLAWLLLTSIVTIGLTGTTGCQKNGQHIPNAMKPAIASAAKSNNAFALALYRQLSRTKKGKNLFFSPYSISAALTMTASGAKGNTAKEMRAVLNHTLTKDKLHKTNGWLLNNLNQRGRSGAFQLTVANQLWGQKGQSLMPTFLKRLQLDYKAALQPMDFGQVEPSRQQINRWIEAKTNNKIKDLLPKGSINKSTKLVLGNAIYFKGKWASQFKPADTRPAFFTDSPRSRVKISMMNQTIKNVQYMENKDLQAIALPYKGKSISMVLVLPKQRHGLSAIEQKLDAKMLENIAKRMSKEEKVLLSLPQFKLTQQTALKPLLQAMGMTQAFGTRADFSGINGKKDLYIGGAYHKALIEVNEEGTEAAAATAVVVMTKSVPRRVEFRADHPFVFAIRDNVTGTILFMGRVLNPKG